MVPIYYKNNKTMLHDNGRRKFIQKIGLTALSAGACNFLATDVNGHTSCSPTINSYPDLVSLPPSDLFSVLNLDLPELSFVRKSFEKNGYYPALSRLLDYYRSRYPQPSFTNKGMSGIEVNESVKRADNLGNHIFQWGPYTESAYGDDIDWAADPAGDIEWVAAIYRFYWASDLVDGYLATGDDRYVQTFVDLTTDWINKHPLEKTINITHPVYGWKGYPWLDLQTGIRATNICSSFRQFLHSKAFTPQFLGILLSSLYDHQIKTEKMPMNKVHNKAIFEQRGFFNVLHTFPEFKDKERWLNIAIDITCENLIAQTTSEGVQREWCGGYHLGVYRDVLEIDGRVKDMGHEMPEFYRNRVKAMADHIFGLSTPDLGFPMFGDTARSKPESDNRKSWQLYKTLVQAGQAFKDPKFEALADLDISRLPSNGSKAFPDAGLYALRNNWTPDQVYMALHCSPPAISSHDTADNGTFELYAYGRWLMPDSGYYTYGHDKKARAWHRQTKIHPTMTVNGKDTAINGRQLCWKSDENMDILCIENHSYNNFLHRRTVWFVDKNEMFPFFVIADEANGDINGDIEIHFPMAPGPVKTDNQNNRIITGFNDANLLIQITGKKSVTLYETEGWHAWSYGHREPRTSVTALYKGQAPFVFISLLIPYTGITVPECRMLTDTSSLISGMDPMKVEVEVSGRNYKLIRNI